MAWRYVYVCISPLDSRETSGLCGNPFLLTIRAGTILDGVPAEPTGEVVKNLPEVGLT